MPPLLRPFLFLRLRPCQPRLSVGRVLIPVFGYGPVTEHGTDPAPDHATGPGTEPGSDLGFDAGFDAGFDPDPDSAHESGEDVQKGECGIDELEMDAVAEQSELDAVAVADDADENSAWDFLPRGEVQAQMQARIQL